MIALIDSDVDIDSLPSYIGNNGYYTTSAQPHYLIHRLKASKAIGRPLKSNEVVHHIDGNKLNNRNDNLLICTPEYHKIIHARERIIDLGGHPDTHSYCWKCEDIHPLEYFNRCKANWNGVAGVCRKQENSRRRVAKYRDRRDTISIREKNLRMMSKMKWHFKKTGQEDRVCWLW